MYDGESYTDETGETWVFMPKMNPASLLELRDIWMGEPMDFVEEFPDLSHYLAFSSKEEYVLTYPNGRALHITMNGMHERNPFVALEMGWDPNMAVHRYVHSSRKDTFFAFSNKSSFGMYLREFEKWDPIQFSGETLKAESGLPLRLGSTVIWRVDREKTVLPKSLYEYARTVLDY